jgi:hypothetical protein
VADLAEADQRRPLLYVRSMEGLGRCSRKDMNFLLEKACGATAGMMTCGAMLGNTDPAAQRPNGLTARRSTLARSALVCLT